MVELVIPPRYRSKVDQTQILNAVSTVFEMLQIPPETELTILITSDPRIKQLNNEFLGIPQPTDVLAFPSDSINPESGQPYLGDIAISLPTAELQATASGDSLADELILLLIHGILHLAGFDHGTPNEKAAMWEKQGELLQKMNIQIRELPEK